MRSKNRPTHLGIVLTLALAAANCGCGGGSSYTPSPPSPAPIAVSLSSNAIAIQAGATAQLTATVVHDQSNSGVSWKLTCSIAPSPCGTLSSQTSPSETPISYAPPNPLPSSTATITVTATSAADSSKSDSAAIIPVGHIPGYDVGVDYHAYGSSYDQTAFITQYNQLQIRQMVQAQLQGMADRGATFLHTSIWFVTYPGTTNFGQTWRATFPMTDQEAANLRAYAEDVAAIQGAGGNRLRLDIALEWLGASDYTIGSPTTGLGYNKDLSASEFISRLQTTTDKVLGAVSDVMRPDGVQVADTIFFDDEVSIPGPGETGGKANEGWFLTTNYPRFVSVATHAGIRPSIYFFGADGCTQDVAFDDSYVDSLYPILDGHRSMFWPFRGMKFMVDNGLPLPTGRVDFDCYLISSGANYNQILQRVLDDADATLPSLGALKFYNITETYYLTDPTQRLQYAHAFATQAALSSRLQRVSFWTTPDGGGTGQEEAYPFTIEDFLPPSP